VALDKALLREDFLGNNIRPQGHLQKADSAMRFVDIVLRKDHAPLLVKRARRGLIVHPKAQPTEWVFVKNFAHVKKPLNSLRTLALILLLTNLTINL
jgi:hypothetical protein